MRDLGCVWACELVYSIITNLIVDFVVRWNTIAVCNKRTLWFRCCTVSSKTQGRIEKESTPESNESPHIINVENSFLYCTKPNKISAVFSCFAFRNYSRYLFFLEYIIHFHVWSINTNWRTWCCLISDETNCIYSRWFDFLNFISSIYQNKSYSTRTHNHQHQHRSAKMQCVFRSVCAICSSLLYLLTWFDKLRRINTQINILPR